MTTNLTAEEMAAREARNAYQRGIVNSTVNV